MSQTFGEIWQIAFVVRDIDSAMDYWTRTLGVGTILRKTKNRILKLHLPRPLL